MKPYERRLAQFTHAYLYFILFCMPLVGWIMSSAANYPVSYFGHFTFPNPIALNKALVEPLKILHKSLSWSLLAVAGLHIVAALRHHFVIKDDVLRRMFPGRGK